MNLSPINNFNPSPQDKIAAANAQRNANLSKTQNAQNQNNSDNTKLDAEKSKSDSYTTPDSQSQHLNNRTSPESEYNKAPSAAQQYKPTDKPITSIQHEKSQPTQVEDPTTAQPAPPPTKKTWTDHITETAKARLAERGGQNMQQSEGQPNESLEDTGKPATPPNQQRPQQTSSAPPKQSPQVPKARRPKFSAPPTKLPPTIKLPRIPRPRF